MSPVQIHYHMDPSPLFICKLAPVSAIIYSFIQSQYVCVVVSELFIHTPIENNFNNWNTILVCNSFCLTVSTHLPSYLGQHLPSPYCLPYSSDFSHL